MPSKTKIRDFKFILRPFRYKFSHSNSDVILSIFLKRIKDIRGNFWKMQRFSCKNVQELSPPDPDYLYVWSDVLAKWPQSSDLFLMFILVQEDWPWTNYRIGWPSKAAVHATNNLMH